MAKPHPLMWTGTDIVTTLAPEAIWLAAAEAIVGGKGKVTQTADAGPIRAYDIKGSDTLFATSPELSFDIQISDERDGRRAVRTHILRALLKDGGLFGPKKMLGQKAYVRIAQALGERIRAQDAAATVSMRDGAMPAGFVLDGLSAKVAPPAA
ncbi:hypothetical protein GCM10009840_20490 [Pseudolysinimonas kribbensis]|jgi:hypothetical protein